MAIGRRWSGGVWDRQTQSDDGEEDGGADGEDKDEEEGTRRTEGRPRRD